MKGGKSIIRLPRKVGLAGLPPLRSQFSFAVTNG
jgi:hypothetical protein